MPPDTRSASGAQPRSLIVTVYGAYSRQSNGWLSVSVLVRLLAELGVDEPAVRSSVSRLKQRGLLLREPKNGVVGYALSRQALQILADGDRRIFTRTRASLADGWVLVAFSVPERERSSRHLLRSELTRLGFGTVAPGTWIAPARLTDDTREAVERLGLAAYVELFAADHVAFGELRSRVPRWWDLEGLQAQYSAYLTRWSPVLRRTRRRQVIDGRTAFTDYVLTLTEWRRLPYLDPGLPVEVLPRGWQGLRAGDVFFSLRDQLEEPAAAYVAALQRR